MNKKMISTSVLRLLGCLLLAAASLKGHELLTSPVANKDLWSYRPFLIFQVEFELTLAIWLLWGLWKKVAWCVACLCFLLFSCISVYKGIVGAASCGCFGKIHINPWIILLAIDLPSLILLFFFPPQGATRLMQPILLRTIVASNFRRTQNSTPSSSPDSGTLIPSGRKLFYPLYSLRSLCMVLSILIIIISTSIVFARHVPQQVTTSYEVLEPTAWTGKTLPILGNIDVADELQKGNWLVLLYHHDCPDCAKAVPEYQQMASDLAGNEGFLRLALIEIPPYGQEFLPNRSPCLLGRMDNSKEWFVTTPAVFVYLNLLQNRWLVKYSGMQQ